MFKFIKIILPPMEKIDIHCHTTNRPLPDTAPGGAGIPLILQKMDEHDIAATVLLATYFPHKSSGITNFRLASWIRDKPCLFLFGSLDFPNYFNQGMNELEEFADDDIMLVEKAMQGFSEEDKRKVYFENARRILLG